MTHEHTTRSGQNQTARHVGNRRLPGAARLIVLGAGLGIPTTFVFAQRAPSGPLTTTMIAERATPATVTIQTFGAAGDTLLQGSGFFIRSNGTLVTNYHVMRGAARAVVTRPNGERFDRVTVLDGDSTLDLAILKVPGYDLPVLTSRSTVPAVGAKVVAIGSPLGLSRTVSELIQVTAAISPGSSGGAVLDDQGRVFGISTLHLNGGQSLNFAVPIRYALGLLGAGTPREMAIADIFGANGDVSATGDGGAAAASATRRTGVRLVSPPRASVPRRTLDGVYSVRHIFGDTVGSERKGGVLVIGEDQRSWYQILPYVNDTLADWGPVVAGRDTRTTSNGDVAFAIGKIAFDGYQTDSGFVVRGVIPAEGKTPETIVRLYATQFTSKLSSTIGNYACSWNPSFRAKRSSEEQASTTRWTTSASVMLDRDSVYVGLYASNADGGTTSFVSAGPRSTNGNFMATERGGSILSGKFDNGVFRGDWTDMREGGAAFIGFVRCERR
jgi:hypothetical protein